jgi:hypothetical protein
MIDGFLLGIIVAASLVAAAYFLKFWRKTHDRLFLGFGAAFFIEGCNRMVFLFVPEPEAGNPVIYAIRLVSYLLILAAIAHKNRGRGA